MNFDIKYKKLIAMVTGIALSLLFHYLGLEPSEIMAYINSPVAAFIIGQGVADIGKEAEKIKKGIK